MHGQHLPGAAQAGLHLVGDPQHIVLVAQSAHTRQVGLRKKGENDKKKNDQYQIHSSAG